MNSPDFIRMTRRVLCATLTADRHLSVALEAVQMAEQALSKVGIKYLQDRANDNLFSLQVVRTVNEISSALKKMDDGVLQLYSKSKRDSDACERDERS